MAKKLIAIDGNSLLYRAFFAVRYLSTSEGQPTNAIFGLTSMLLKVLEEKPDYIAVAFDTPRPTFRHEEFPDYKAQRKAIPEALLQQTEIARELVRAFNIPVVEVPGYEADDIIGAIAREAEKQGVETLIVTGDLDTLQLVNEHTKVMTTQKGVSDTIVYDAYAVKDRFGLAPKQMTDYKGLKGDPSDNIPGVPGIGEKTAIELLKQYGTLENLLEHISELPEGRVKKALEEHRELARLSKRLATIVTDLPDKPNLEQFRTREPDYDALRDLFVRLEFKTFLKRLPEVGTAEGKRALEERPTLGACRRITSEQELRELLDEIERAGECAIHCHIRDGKSTRAELIGISFCTTSHLTPILPEERNEDRSDLTATPNLKTAYVEVIDTSREGLGQLELGSDFRAPLSELKAVLESDRIAKYCHDSKINHAALALRNVALKGVTFDTMLAGYLIDSGRASYEIADLAFERLSLELPGFMPDKDSTNSQLPTPNSYIRVCAEAEAIYRLKPVLESKLEEDGLGRLFHDVELPLAPILAEMELTGVAVDVEQLEALSITLDIDIRETERRIYEMAGEKFNIGSTKQLQTILFEKMGLTAAKKTKTGFSTSAAALEEMAADHPIIGEILNWRELTKLKSTYADALPKLINPETGRIHTSLNQTVTATGRLSSSDPNLQNIPIRTELGREIRKAFVASEGNILVSADYSQIELRILAHFTNDENLVRAFENDEDIHSATACVIFNCSPSEVTPEMRRRAKTINFAVIYGMADFTLGRVLGISTHEAREYIATYFAKMPGVKAYVEETIATARERGYVTTLFGRRRYVPDIHSSNYNIRMNAERAAVNMPVQGTAADLMKIGMIRVRQSLGDTNARMLLQVHDELLFECPPSEAERVAQIARNGMGGAHNMRVPLKVDVKAGKNWAEMKEIRS
ncbi:MAG: DNA polymerase I [Armatimonadetes bacterium]|nr:DNA polymerase I [Armatimonadota bacterium]